MTFEDIQRDNTSNLIMMLTPSICEAWMREKDPERAVTQKDVEATLLLIAREIDRRVPVPDTVR